MRGITEKRLREWRRISIQKGLDDLQVRELLDHLIKECKELNPWQPIESSPKDRPILLRSEEVVTEGSFVHFDHGYWMQHCTHDEINPTHWQNLPGNPK